MSQSRWSKDYRIDESEKDVVLGIKVTLYTRSLTLPELDPERVAGLKLMSDLNDQGVSNYEMSDWFNAMELPTPRGTSYTPKLIWGSIHKWKKRRERIRDTYRVIEPPKFYLSIPRRIQ